MHYDERVQKALAPVGALHRPQGNSFKPPISPVYAEVR